MLDGLNLPRERLGMRTVWLLRGDAPPAPTLDQLTAPDAVTTSLTGLPTASSRLTGSTAFDSPPEGSAVEFFSDGIPTKHR